VLLGVAEKLLGREEDIFLEKIAFVSVMVLGFLVRDRNCPVDQVAPTN
jgi:hypothetical protein